MKLGGNYVVESADVFQALLRRRSLGKSSMPRWSCDPGGVIGPGKASSITGADLIHMGLAEKYREYDLDNLFCRAAHLTPVKLQISHRLSE